MKFSRVFAMPSADTFSIRPIRHFVKWYLKEAKVSVDPFARNKRWCTHTNDLNPQTTAEYHMDALDYCVMLQKNGVSADLVIFDPPYSARQISEVYAGVGHKATQVDTQGSFYTKRKDALDAVLFPGGMCLSFGWNTNGMGLERGYCVEEILIVNHGGWHNDTLCIAERKINKQISMI